MLLLLLHQSEIGCTVGAAGRLGANKSRRRTRGDRACCRAAVASSTAVAPPRSSSAAVVAKQRRRIDDPVREVRSRYQNIFRNKVVRLGPEASGKGDQRLAYRVSHTRDDRSKSTCVTARIGVARFNYTPSVA